MANGELTAVAVLQIGDRLVPILRKEAPQIRAREKRDGRVQFNRDLEGETLVLARVLRCDWPIIDYEHRYGLRSLGQSRFGISGIHVPHKQCETQTTALRHFVVA